MNVLISADFIFIKIWRYLVCLSFFKNSYKLIMAVFLKNYPLSCFLSRCIPEFVIENIVCYLVFLRRFNQKVLEEQGYERLKPLLTCILLYMGSFNRARNPHLRACLAEALEALLPYHKDEPNNLSNLGSQRQLLFVEHEHRKQVSSIQCFLNILIQR